MSSLLVSLLSSMPPVVLGPLILSIGLVILSWIYIRVARGKYDMSTYSRIPGKWPLPMLGNALDLNVPMEKFLETIYGMVKNHGPVMKLMLGHRPYVVLSNADGFETILASNKHITKGMDYKFLHPWLGLGLLTSTGQKWHSRRKLLTPAFHFKILDDFLVVMNEQSNVMVKKLMETNGEKVNIFPHVTLCSLDIICESAMGRSVNAQDKSDSPYVQSIFKASDLLFERMVFPWLWSDAVYWITGKASKLNENVKVLHDFTSSVITDRRRLLNETKHDQKTPKEDDEDLLLGKKKRLAFLDLLIEATTDGKKLSDADIREEVDTFMFEGHDTTAANMTFTLYLLASHPKIQKKVQDELDDIFEGDKDRTITNNDLVKMKYLESCIKEALRLFPSVPMMSRTIHEETVIQNHVVPANTHIMLLTYYLHRDPAQFPDPEKFDPDRFSTSNTRERHPYSYVPFSAGPRNCIGQKFAMMEEKVVIASVLRRFDLVTDLNPSQVEILPEIILRPKSGIEIALKQRK